MKTLTNRLPLTTDDIIVLKGQPIAKRIAPHKKSSLALPEEWTYYNIYSKTKKYYLFKNGYLVKYKTEKAV